MKDLPPFMLYNIQALRAVAAFLVVLVHVDRLTELAGFGKGATAFGNTGVDLFFVISGLIMVVTTVERPQTAAHFIRHRVARVVPLYWAVTIAVFVLALVLPLLFETTRANPGELAKSLAFIPYQRADGQMHPIVFVGWTLNYEMFFYALFALGMLLPGRVIGYAFSLVMLLSAVVVGRFSNADSTILQFYTQPLLLEFGAGMILGVLFAKDILPKRTTFAIPIGIIAFTVMLVDTWIWPNTDRSVIAGIPAMFIVASALVAEQQGRRFKGVLVQLLGASSYSIYLTHFFVTQVFIKFANHLSQPSELSLFLILLSAMTLVAVVGILVHRLVELPLTAWARSLLGGRHAPLPQEVASSELELPTVELSTPHLQSSCFDNRSPGHHP